MWILLSVCAAAGMCIIVVIRYWVRVFCRTAWIVVHPWNLGFTAAEMQSKINSLPRRIRGDAQQQASIVEKHLEYFQRLEFGLRRAYARWIILCDEHETIDCSVERVYHLTALPRRIRFFERFGRFREVVEVVTRPGRATPSEGNWEKLFAAIYQAGIRRIFVVGSYLGERNGCLVEPDDLYFCVNDVAQQARASMHFECVTVLPDLCYQHEVPDKPEPVTRQIPGFRTRKRTGNKRKKKR